MAQKDKPRRNKLYNQAKSEAKLFIRPQVRGLKRDRRMARQDARRAENALQSAYGGYQDLLAPMDESYISQSQDIAGALTEQLGSMQDLIGYGTPQPETEAARLLYGTIGAGSQGVLSSQQQRGLDWLNSASVEGGLAQRYGLENVQQELQENLGNIRWEKQGVLSGLPALIQQRLDQLRQQKLENQLAQSSMQSDEAFRQYLMDLIGIELKGEKNKPHRNNRNDRRNDRTGPTKPPLE